MNIAPNPSGWNQFIRYAKKQNKRDAIWLENNREKLKAKRAEKAAAIRRARAEANAPADIANAIYRQQPISTTPELRKSARE